MFPEYVTGKIDDLELKEILELQFPYYAKLNIEQKALFEKRTQHFLETKKFVPRVDLVISDEMRVLTCACAIQLTLGFNEYRITQYEYVLMYPDVYQSPHTKKMHHGEVNLSGFICFSWKSLQIGIKYAHDNFNVGLHEWSHALRFNSVKGPENDAFFDAYFPKIIATGASEFQKLKEGKTRFFREYAGANVNEFFSVAIEYFFESPEEFRRKLPPLFEQFCILLNQEPREKQIYLNVRYNLLDYKSHLLFTRLLAKGTSYGGLFSVAPVLLCLIFIAIHNFSTEEGMMGLGSIAIMVILIILLFVFPKMKKILVFEEGILLSWMMSGLIRKDSLMMSFDQIIHIEFKPDKGSYESMSVTYYSNREIKEIDLDCRLTPNQVTSLTDHLRKKKVNVLMRPMDL